MIVADASLIANLLIQQPGSSLADAVLLKDAAWWVPGLWRFELHSALLECVKSGQLLVQECNGVMDRGDRTVQGNEQSASSVQVLQTAAAHGISSYDAEYVALARELRVPLVTFDQKLVRAARGIAVSPEDFVG